MAEYQSLGTCRLRRSSTATNALLEREAIAPAVGHPRDGCRVVERVLQRGLRQERFRRRLDHRHEAQVERALARPGADLGDRLLDVRRQFADIGGPVREVRGGPLEELAPDVGGDRQLRAGVGGERDVAERARHGPRQRRIVLLAARRGIELVAHRVGVPVRAIPVDDRVGERHDLERVRARRRTDRDGEHDAAVGPRELAEAHDWRAVGQEDAVRRRGVPGDPAKAAAAGPAQSASASGHDGLQARGAPPRPHVVAVAAQHD